MVTSFSLGSLKSPITCLINSSLHLISEFAKAFYLYRSLPNIKRLVMLLAKALPSSQTTTFLAASLGAILIHRSFGIGDAQLSS